MRTLLVTLVILFICVQSYAYRIIKPQTFSYPWTKAQVNQLNDTLNGLWLMQNGRYETDIVTTTKTSAKNGEMWLIKTGTTVRIQYKANNHIFTLTPDGF